MATRSFNGTLTSIENQPRVLWAEVSIGSSGAATLVRGKGIASVAKTGTGVYAITLSDLYTKLLFVGSQVKNTTTVPNAPYVFESAADTVTTTKIITITTAAFSGSSGAVVATEPASGNVYRFEIKVKTANYDI